ncbi:hypothetical protein V6N12_014606 [Hibiscus sabdariffa]|uniref:pyruvate decarboxylase n=1 Tax=Hibiscus sabdariffa TaxID=183260 RepID=A0ABR2DKP2_9ROSI
MNRKSHFERKSDVEIETFGRYEFQMQHGSIGWSVGATLVYAQAVPEKLVIACIGDGSFHDCARCVNNAAVWTEDHNLSDKQWCWSGALELPLLTGSTQILGNLVAVAATPASDTY